MLFDDNFVMGHALGAQDLGGFNDAFGGPSRYDAGEIVVVGRIPGALYVDDLVSGETFLEHILPFQRAADLVANQTLDQFGQAHANGDDPVTASLSPTGADDGQLSAALTSSSIASLIAFEGDGRVDLTSAAPVDSVAPRAAGDGDLPFTLIGGQAYQSLSFLIIDTPYAVGDSHLSETLRPSVDALLGLTDPNDSGDVWVLPAQGHRSWLLN